MRAPKISKGINDLPSTSDSKETDPAPRFVVHCPPQSPTAPNLAAARASRLAPRGLAANRPRGACQEPKAPASMLTSDSSVQSIWKTPQAPAAEAQPSAGRARPSHEIATSFGSGGKGKPWQTWTFFKSGTWLRMAEASRTESPPLNELFG